MIAPAKTPWLLSAPATAGLVAWLLAFLAAPTLLPVGWGALGAFVGAVLGSLLLLIALGLKVTGAPQGVLFSGRNTYSLSRLQMTLWTILILSALMAAAACRAWDLGFGQALGIAIPPELLQVMGVSYVSAAAAPAVLSLKSRPPTDDQMAAASARMGEPLVPSGQVVSRPPDADPLLTDLVAGDELANAGMIDLGKVQQLVITVMLVVIYAGMLGATFLATRGAIAGLPGFSQDFVTLLLVSHGGYLAAKAVSKPDAPSASALQRPAPPADRNAT